MNNADINKSGLFWPLVRLTLLYIISQCIIIYMNFHSVLNGTPINKFIMQQVVYSPTVIIGMIAFGAAQIALNLLWILAVMACSALICRLLHLSSSSYISIGLLLWFDSLIAMFISNQLLFTHSIFAFLLDIGKKLYPSLQPYLTPDSLKTTLVVTGGLLAVALVLACISLLREMIRQPKWGVSLLLLPVVAFSSGYYFSHHSNAEPPLPNGPHAGQKPNIILLSMDYFRPTDTTYFGHDVELTPNVDTFLRHATVFNHTITPIARTFPSLMTVESGSYPIKNGARFNLIDPTHVNHQMTLAHTLQDQGYYTMMGTDGSHFFYMTKDYGYNQIIAPPPGLNEFLLSSINDFPLSNLLMNSPVGKYLFPYNYMNRNASFTYEPETFNHEIAEALSERPDKPLYIHIHLTLAAWPYSWSSPAPLVPADLNKTERIHYRFNVGLKAVDNQFGEILSILDKQKLLDNALIVVFSDHGQAFGEVGDRLTDAKNLVGKASKKQIEEYTQLNTVVGHGTDVLSMKQYHPLLAFKITGPSSRNEIGKRPLIASLIDIAPTVLNYLNIANPGMQGISLLPEITSFPQTGLGNRPLFMETEFTLPSILTADPSIESVIKQGITYYNLNTKTGILQIKPEIGRLIIKGKQRAILQGKWLLAFYPNSTGSGTLVLVDMATKAWTLDMSSTLAQTSPVNTMWQELHDFYGKEIQLPALPHEQSRSVIPPPIPLMAAVTGEKQL